MDYEDRIVCFIDILGFREHIKQSSTLKGGVLDISEAFLAMRRVLDLDDPEMLEIDGLQITQFSDCVVISFKAEQKSGVFYALLRILWIQGTLVNHGMLLRGAIVRGGLIHTDKVLFGPGLVDAHYRETTAVIYPRIVVDNEVIKIGKEFAEHSPKKEGEYINGLLSKDFDGMYIDYFGKSIMGELDNPEYDYPEYLNQLYKIISDNISSNSPSIKFKICWMKEKYNQEITKIKQWLDEDKNNSEFRILYKNLDFVDD